VVLVGQLIVGVIAIAASRGVATPAVIGWIGLGTATGIGLFDAAQEYNLGNKTTAGIMAIIEMLPLVSKIPVVKNAVRSVGKSLARKLASGARYFTSQERFLLQQLDINSDAIEAELKELEKNVANKGQLPDSNDFGLGQGDMQLQKLYGAGNDGVVGVYGKEVSKNPSVFLALANKAKIDDYISYQHVIQPGKSGYYLSMKTELVTAASGTFKSLMTKLSKILPDHKLFEKTNISTDGIMMWKNQIKAGYKSLSETFTVPVNNAGGKINLNGLGGKFDPAKFSSKEAAESAKKEIDRLISEIPNSKVEIVAPPITPPVLKIPGKSPYSPPAGAYTLKVTLPVLQSTTKSLNALGITAVMITPAVLKDIQSKE
jgi:hypothetical protein